MVDRKGNNLSEEDRIMSLDLSVLLGGADESLGHLFDFV
jgi:hypothetical protein